MRHYELKHPNGFVIGVATENWNEGYPEYLRGWRFYPRVSGRSPSRRGYPTADACLPTWARKRLKSGCSFGPRGETASPQAPREPEPQRRDVETLEAVHEALSLPITAVGGPRSRLGAVGCTAQEQLRELMRS